METPPIVSPEEWAAAHARMLVKEKAHLREHDALVAERRRMPWMKVEKDYIFEGPDGHVGLADLFAGRRQLIVYRAFFETGVHGWPDHACIGCSLGADQLSKAGECSSLCGNGQYHRPTRSRGWASLTALCEDRGRWRKTRSAVAFALNSTVG